MIIIYEYWPMLLGILLGNLGVHLYLFQKPARTSISTSILAVLITIALLALYKF